MTDLLISKTLLSCVLIAVVTSVSLADKKPGDMGYQQKPEIAASQVVGAQEEPKKEERTSNQVLQQGPKPRWIWGASDAKDYYLRTTFDGSNVKSAALMASCDNAMVVFVNGTRVAQGSEWSQAARANVTKHIKSGENELLVKAENQGGPAGFILKLALTSAKGKVHYVNSGKDWQATLSRDSKEWKDVRVGNPLGAQPWGNVFSGSSQTGGLRDVFELLPGFQVERLFTVPKSELGSWVCITADPQGRIIASDQGNKGLCRIYPPKIGSDDETLVEQLDVKMTSAQGMLFAFDSLYVCANGGPGSGLYRLRDTNNDEAFDEVTKLKDFRGGGEHGPHALRLSPDGKSIYVIAGNHTDPPQSFHASRIPSNWGEDLLLPRQWDANGHARGKLAPGGWIAKTDPDGKTWEVFSIGYRNPYDMDFNADGELFAYDADMEWDMGSPWYRPTRVVHATSGSEFGWRSGTGKWPTYFVDSLPPAVNIGPGSPVGVSFGYGAKFPAKYQKALYICDWTFGTMYAIHLQANGSSYTATKEEFLSRTPLPLTDVTIGTDGAMYFTVGGRGAQSELFRVTYVGDESTETTDARDSRFAQQRTLRRQLEAMHSPSADVDLRLVYKSLGDADRHIRYAARIALEHAPIARWKNDVLALSEPKAVINGSVAVARQGEASDQGAVLAALAKIDFGKLDEFQQLALLRAYQLAFARLGKPTESAAASVAKRLDVHFPAKTRALNRELSRVLVYLESPGVTAKTVALLKEDKDAQDEDLTSLIARNNGYARAIRGMMESPPNEQQIHYAFVLRNAKKGWKLDDRLAYFQWFNTAKQWSGGNSFRKFLQNIDDEAFLNASEKDRLAVQAFGARQSYKAPALPKPKGPGKTWSTEEVRSLVEAGLKGRNFENGKKMFAATRCVICHRFAGDGGATGPDLTQLAGRFNVKDLTDSIIDPSKVISDQYKATTIRTIDGKSVTGRIVSESEKTITVVTDPEDATKFVEVARDDIDAMKPSVVSLMPKDLLNPLNQDEVLDLMAYLLSRGQKNNAMFRK